MAVYKDEISQEFRFKTGMDLSFVTGGTIHIKKPSGATQDWDINFKQILEDAVRYYSKAGDLNETGVYEVEYMTIRFDTRRTSNVWYTEKTFFEVKERT